MNLYLVLAIALGAISSLVDAPVLQPVQLVARRESRRQQRQVRVVSAIRTARSPRIWQRSPRVEYRAPRPYGIGSPRAPALA